MSHPSRNRRSDARLPSPPSNYGVPKTGEPDVDLMQVCDSVCTSVKRYSAQHPAVVASLAFLTGFYVGWKTKPW